MYFVVKKNKGGQFWWRAVSDGNNEILAASELMEREQSCLDAIALVRREAAAARVIDKTGETTEHGSV
jgi:uncharacterized protein YegP (UPF0339 family)